MSNDTPVNIQGKEKEAAIPMIEKVQSDQNNVPNNQELNSDNKINNSNINTKVSNNNNNIQNGPPAPKVFLYLQIIAAISLFICTIIDIVLLIYNNCGFLIFMYDDIAVIMIASMLLICSIRKIRPKIISFKIFIVFVMILGFASKYYITLKDPNTTGKKFPEHYVDLIIVRTTFLFLCIPLTFIPDCN